MPQSAIASTTDDMSTTSRTRSTSITASQKSSTSSSSGERRRRQPKKKPNTFKSFFAVKEPSAAAFQHLAEQQKKEMGDKGQLPFGVPSGKIPASAEADYKKAKEIAKEKARLYEEVKERHKAQEAYDRALAKTRAERIHKPSIEVDQTEEELLRAQIQMTADAIRYVSLDPRPSSSSSLPIPTPAHRRTHSRWKAPSLDSLPETTRVSSAYSSPPPSLPASPASPSLISVGVRKQEVAPWEAEADEEEEFPMREGAKKSKSYFSTLIRR
jgi:hypothetical protein